MAHALFFIMLWTSNDSIICCHCCYMGCEYVYPCIWYIFILADECRGIANIGIGPQNRYCNYGSMVSLKPYFMMTSSNGNIFRVTGPLCGDFTGPGEFPTQRPVTRCFDVFFDLRLDKRLSKQPWGWWFETRSWSLWRHRNVVEPCCNMKAW